MLAWMMLTAAVGPTDGKPMAMDDWQQLSIIEVAAQAPSGTHHVRVAAGDLDGDGAADEAILALDCAADGTLTSARYIVAPRDAATGMASGKRQHNPVRFIKEWGPATPQLAKMRPTYDVKTMKGNERKVSVRGWDPEKKESVSDSDWAPITLQGTEGLCPATAAAALKATKTRSNIQNN